MLQFIFQWLLSAIGGALEVLVGLFMGALDMDLNTYIELFPFLAVGYRIFRGIGIGLAAVLAVTSLLRFLVPPIFGAREPQDTVGGILFKSFLAGGLVYGGNYILTAVINIAKIPYEVFLGSDASGNISADFSWDFIGRIAEDISGLDAALVVFEFAVTAVIAWNLIKLMLEVCERYMLVGILLYTSPPFFAMAASSETMLSFKSWVKMFISSCVMMSVSVFFLKLILSGFTIINSGLTESGGRTFVRLLLLLATCKIAQHADSYLGRLGLGTATTGGPLLDDLFAAARSFGSVVSHAGRQKGSRTSVLGAAADAVSRNGGIAGKFVDAARAGRASYAAGDSGDATLQKMQKAFREAGGGSVLPRTVRGPVDVASAAGKAAASSAVNGSSPSKTFKTAASAAGHEIAGQAASLAGSVVDFTDPALAGSRREALNALSEAAAHNAADNSSFNDSLQTEFAGASQPDAFGSSLQIRYGASRRTGPSDAEAASNFAAFGSINPETGSSVTVSESGEILPSARAFASGISIDGNDSSPLTGRIISGQSDAVAEMIAGGYNPSEAFESVPDPADASELASQFCDLAVDTVSTGSPEIADRLLHNPNLLISGTDGQSIGAAAVERLYPDIIPLGASVSGIRSFNFDSVADSYGNRLHGGHGWLAEISDGQSRFIYTGIDQTAYTTLSESERHLYERRELVTGRIEYLKRSELPENIQRTEPVRSHYVRSRSARIRPSVFPRRGTRTGKAKGGK